MAKKKKRSYREACEHDVAAGNSSKFTKACIRRFPHLATGTAPPKPRRRRRRK